MQYKYRIGYIDENEKQVKKYKKRFREFDIDVIGYEFKDNMTFEELMEQVYQSDIDLLMIDYKLDESNKVQFNGEKVEQEIDIKKPLFPHIIFTNKREDAENFVEDWSLIFSKEEIPSKNEEDYDESKTKHFITILKKKIDKYQKRIETKKNIIEELIIKGEKEGLDAGEEDTLISLQQELNLFDKTKANEIPKKLVSVNKLKDISKTRIEAEEFLQSLIQKKKKK